MNRNEAKTHEATMKRAYEKPVVVLLDIQESEGKVYNATESAGDFAGPS
ncbi:hypothetical protein [Sphingorhabdus sp. SMR4y]|nr:hypothetical protein [Sphingorhabdus sp. SMR4y]ASK88667.1 hypothetical protein SPHFLASMR4Y_01921 [Sphingorhabdus sp. SMR4y]